MPSFEALIGFLGSQAFGRQALMERVEGVKNASRGSLAGVIARRDHNWLRAG
jgi:hypothetical protein